MMPTQGPAHHIWGEPEVLSCYSTSTSNSSGQSTHLSSTQFASREKHLPKSVQEHLKQNIARRAESPTSTDSDPAFGPRLQEKAQGSSSRRRSSSREQRRQDPSKAGAPSSSADAEAPAAGEGSGGLPSQGSALHDVGECRPCLYLSSKLGCLNGEACRFCHLAHAKKSRPRPCKATRIQCKQIASMIDTLAPDPQQLLEVTEKLGARSSYMRTILRGKQRQLEEELLGGSVASEVDYGAAHHESGEPSESRTTSKAEGTSGSGGAGTSSGTGSTPPPWARGYISSRGVLSL